MTDTRQIVATRILRRITLGSFGALSVLCVAVFTAIGVAGVTHAETECAPDLRACAMPIDGLAP
jgi:hypothetical protein